MLKEISVEGTRVITHAYDIDIDTDEQTNWLTYDGKSNVSYGYWERTKEYMLENEPSLAFFLREDCKVDFRIDDRDSLMKSMLNRLTDKLRYKKYQAFIPWIACFQDYLIETNWKKKKISVPKKKTPSALETALRTRALDYRPSWIASIPTGVEQFTPRSFRSTRGTYPQVGSTITTTSIDPSSWAMYHHGLRVAASDFINAQEPTGTNETPAQ